MSGNYAAALEAAGAEVHEFKEFGDYQGSWYARVTYKGETGWISGSYGSCSGCDAFEAEFGYYDDKKPDYQCRLASFGEGYLGGVLPAAHFLDMKAREYGDDELREAQEWIRSVEAQS